jgi:hypothetical protein
MLCFEGSIDTPESEGPTGSHITLTCRDLGKTLQDRMIEEEQPPPAGSASNWYTELLHAWPAGDLAVEEWLQMVLDHTFSPATAPTINVEDDPDWQMVQPSDDREFVKQGPLLDYVRGVVQQIGFDLRYRWSEDDSEFALTLWNPPRVYEAETWGLSPDLFRVDSSKDDVFNVRNRIAIWYSDENDGGAVKLTNFLDDTDSQALYGIRTMIPTKDVTGNISTDAEATRLRALLLGDLGTPWHDVSVTTIALPFAMLGDCVRLDGGHELWTYRKWFALNAIRHRATATEATSSFDMRMIRISGAEDIPPASGNNSAGFGAGRIHKVNLGAVPMLPNVIKKATPTNVSVFAYQSTGDEQNLPTTVATTVLCPAKGRDRGGDYDIGTGEFTAPMTGSYSAVAKVTAALPPNAIMTVDLVLTQSSSVVIHTANVQNLTVGSANRSVTVFATGVRMQRGDSLKVDVTISHTDVEAYTVVGEDQTNFTAFCMAIG